MASTWFPNAQTLQMPNCRVIKTLQFIELLPEQLKCHPATTSTKSARVTTAVNKTPTYRGFKPETSGITG